MSLQVNISSPEIGKAYQDVLNDRGINWAVFTYEKVSNDLRVQSTGDGGLEELEEEFSDGRYAPIAPEDEWALILRLNQDPVRVCTRHRADCTFVSAHSCTFDGR